ncbi:hypothetical protein ABIA33_000319 [Streptacidiphilus sp. MAP12-16]|uniref:hypothetical protein n=1 Tax=Streptacidiphilus sp. MAP12-16 TaxID=3156300 RepID=UPI00351172D4
MSAAQHGGSTEQSAPPTPVAGPAPGRAARRRRRPGWLLLSPLLLLPPLATLLGVDAVVPAALLIATAGLLRAGDTLFDRFLLSAALLAGALPAFGLLLSVWPWGLQPLAVGELGVCVLLAAAAATGRQFALPRRFPARDWVLTATAAAVTSFYLRPMLGSGSTARLSKYISAEDLARHFGLFDSIRNLGGYAFLNTRQNVDVLQPGMAAYPQGSHFDLALLDRFLNPGAGTPVSELPHFLMLTTLVCAGFVIAVSWAACRVAGPRLGGAVALPLAVLTSAYLCMVEGTAMLDNGFLSEMFGLGLFAVLLAVAVRPVGRPREQLLLMSALLVGISFSYYLWVPVSGAVVVSSLLVHRRSTLTGRHPLAVLCVGGVTAVLVVVPVAVNWSVVNSSAVLNTAGGIIAVSRHLLIPLVAVVALLSLLAVSRGDRAARVTCLALLWSGLAAFAVLEYQTHTIGHSSYYYEKMLHQLAVAALVGTGSAAVLQPRGTAAAGNRLWAAVLSVAACGCVLLTAYYNAQGDGSPAVSAVDRAKGYLYDTSGEDAVARTALREAGATDSSHQPMATLILLDSLKKNYQGNYYATLWVNVLNRTAGKAGQLASWGFVPVERVRDIPHTLPAQLDTLDHSLRVVTDSATVRRDVLAYAGAHPDRDVELHQVSG